RAENLTSKSIYTIAPRGQIFDRNGQLLAGNKPSFNVRFSPDGLKSEEINAQSLELMKLFEKNGDSYVDNFPILISANGAFYYTYQQTIEEWLESENMPTSFSAQQAFDELCLRYGIEEGLDKYEAQSELQNTYGIYPPISVKNMVFTEDLEKESFLGRYQLDQKTTEKSYTAKEAFDALRERFEIDDSVSDQDARRIMVIRNELSALGYMGYVPAKIAENVCDATIIEIEERSDSFKGVDVAAESVRYYPNGNTASHILGYLGKISESEKAAYLEKGYSSTDMVGKDGIESAMEDKLKGTDGVEVVQVNASGKKTGTISKTEATKGQDVYLTIDLELQKVAEESLKKILNALQTGGTFESEWGNVSYATNVHKNANVGAVVAIEVDTGDVLAMASNPDFDPNLFATGISPEDWSMLQKENPRDALSPAPLYNVAARTAVQPGSTFKPVTATAAYASGLNPNQKYRDGGYLMLGNQAFNCLVWTTSHSTHGMVDLKSALEVSCNYYFYDLATNYDWANKHSLGLDADMGVEKIAEYAQQYGLGQSTGIEISETVGNVLTEEKKIASYKAMLRLYLRNNKSKFFTAEVLADSDKTNEAIDTIVSWTEENPTRKVMLERLPLVGIREDMVETVTDNVKYTYFNYAKLNTADALNVAIGQGENAYTPLQMANYVATLANGGQRNQVSLVKGIEGEGQTTKPEPEKVDVDDASFFDILLEGMRRVAHGTRGSARKYFANFPVEVAAKT
ncbi:MAG: penicillin-binding protein, partial [Firmicutes bacterium]|nr:penicillin-binding protein [Bacillota bacterium]